MTANTVYDIFLALPEMERQRHIELVNEYKRNVDTKFSKLSKTKKKEFTYTKQDALDYLLKNIFCTKN
ncbi:hypothetical protein [Flavobacterium petrolei]|uniref:hypothetical protein n=1 Tax=Flavobacterium petrolei TaxID=2259594 RepID=UPI0037567B15